MRALLALIIVMLVTMCCVNGRLSRSEKDSKTTQEERNLLNILRELLKTSHKSPVKSEKSARNELPKKSKKSMSKRDWHTTDEFLIQDEYMTGPYTTPNYDLDTADRYDYTTARRHTTPNYENWDWPTDSPGYDEQTTTSSHNLVDYSTPSDVYGCVAPAELYGPRGEFGIRPSEYKDKMHCQWKISVGPSKRVRIHFKRFGLEEASGTAVYDSVKVYDGEGISNPLLRTLSGSDVPADITSTGNTLLVTFSTDQAYTYSGFLIAYSERGRDSASCGYPDVDPVFPGITGGSVAEPSSWPWQVSLQEYQPGHGIVHYCGASILSENWLLTSPECLIGRTGNQITVVVGAHCLGRNGNTEMSLNASQFFEEEGLIKMKWKITYNRWVSPVCLPKQTVTDGTMCMTTGWGNASDSNCLNQVAVSIDKTNSLNELRGGYSQRGKNQCQGDEGGPLVCKSEEGVWELQGIHVNQINACAGEPKSTIFTEVTSFIEMIEEIVQANGGW